KRLIACRANLLKALGALKDDQRAWAPRFRLGTHTVSLRRSLVLAGESEAQYDAHLERFRRALAPRDTVERKLTGALADVCWRRLRILRLHSRREHERLRGLLRGAVTRRWAAAGNESLWDRTTAQSVLEAFAEGVPPLPWGVSTNDVPAAEAAREGETFQRNVSTEAMDAFAAHLRLMGAAFPPA